MQYLETLSLLAEIKTLSAMADPDEDDSERLEALESLRDEVRGNWNDNITLIPESEWEEYCQNTAYDLGFVQRDSPIDFCIDWSRWADSCRSDYYSVDFDGETYFYRAF